MSHKIDVSYTATWTVTVDVPAPVNATPDPIRELADAIASGSAVNADIPNRAIGVSCWCWNGPAPGATPPNPAQVPEAMWLDVDGVRWASSWYFAVRADAPMPSAWRCDGRWATPDPQLAGAIRQMRQDDAPFAGWLSPAMRPMVEGAYLTEIPGGTSAACWRDGVLTGIVGRLREPKAGDLEVAAGRLVGVCEVMP